jgi:hypothetical protein
MYIARDIVIQITAKMVEISKDRNNAIPETQKPTRPFKNHPTSRPQRRGRVCEPPSSSCVGPDTMSSARHNPVIPFHL